jgi:hypothetical protein
LWHVSASHLHAVINERFFHLTMTLASRRIAADQVLQVSGRPPGVSK